MNQLLQDLECTGRRQHYQSSTQARERTRHAEGGREAAPEHQGYGSHTLCKAHSQLTEEGLARGPVPGPSSCFSIPLAVSCALFSPILISGYPDEGSYLLFSSPTIHPLGACDHMRRYSPASMHRHNGGAPPAPRR